MLTLQYVALATLAGTFLWSIGFMDLISPKAQERKSFHNYVLIMLVLVLFFYFTLVYMPATTTPPWIH